MKNITVTVDDEAYRKARIKAAQRSTSVSALVREFLLQLDIDEGEDARFDRLLREQNELIARARVTHAGFSPAENVSRDELHDRHAIP